MSDYQRMISAATVGFGAKPFPTAAFDAPVDGSVAAVCDAADPVGSVLRVAGLYALAQRAGQRPEHVEVGSDPAPPETRPLITDAHAFLIERALTARPILRRRGHRHRHGRPASAPAAHPDAVAATAE
ncbi:hypothetical protein H7H51_00720 [Mycolicibacterium farcinogenes]|nr:hypothetical protein [Mycolicibacterium farcinogenes]